MEQPQVKKKVPDRKNKLKRPMKDGKLTSPKPPKTVCLSIPLLSQSGTSKNDNNISSKLINELINHFIEELTLLIKKEIFKSVEKNDQSLNDKAETNFSKKAGLLMNNLKKLVEEQQTRNSFLENQVKNLEKDKADLESKLLGAQNVMMAQINRLEDKMNKLSNNKRDTTLNTKWAEPFVQKHLQELQINNKFENFEKSSKSNQERTNSNEDKLISNNNSYETDSSGLSEVNEEESESSTDAELDLTPVTSGNITPVIELDLTSDTNNLQLIENSSPVRQNTNNSTAQMCEKNIFKHFPLPKEFSLNDVSGDDDTLQSKEDILTVEKNSAQEICSNLRSCKDVTNSELVLVGNETNNLQIQTSNSIDSTSCKYCDDFEIYQWKIDNNMSVCQPTEDFYRKFLRLHNCLPSEVYCEKCGQLCNWEIKKKRWRCDKTIKTINKTDKTSVRKRCNFAIQEKTNTIFAASQIRFDQWMTFFSEFTKEKFSGKNAILKADLTHSTMVQWLKKCSQICADALANEKIGGFGRTVEIDDSLFVFNKEVRKNRQPTLCRVFGGVEVGSLKSFVVYLNDGLENDRSSLKSLIVKHVLPGTTVCYKGGEGYEDVANLTSPGGRKMDYFVNISPHQRLCEGLWEDLKRNIRRKGLKSSTVENYIYRYMFYRKYPVNTLHHFLLQVGLSYPCSRGNKLDSENFVS